jgi:hypothetical protein
VIGVCKFCKCTDNSPCVIQGNYPSQLDGVISPQSFACAWLLEDVCTNPACVEAAYLEARPQAEELMQKLDMILEAA